MNYINCFLIFCFFLQAAEAAETLDLITAANRAIEFSPKLQGAAADIQASAGDVKQASLYPNPFFYFVAEPSGDVKKFFAFDEKTYQIQQPIELGGKRTFRQRAATYEYYASLAGYDRMRVELLNAFNKEFINVVAAQEFYALASEKKKIAQEMLEVVQEKLKSGKNSIINVTKMEIIASRAEQEEKSAALDLEAEKERLALFWGCEEPDFDEIEYDFYCLSAPPPLDLSKLECQSEILGAQYEYLAAQANLELEKSYRIPDVDVSVGYTKSRTSIEGMTIGLGIPILIFDRNQGNIQRAAAEVAKAEAEYQELWLELKTKMTYQHKKMAKAYEEAQKLKEKIMLLGSEACDLLQEGHEKGKLEYMEILENKNDMLEIKKIFIEILTKYHDTRTDLEYLTTQTD